MKKYVIKEEKKLWYRYRSMQKTIFKWSELIMKN